jgi:hypothetical protein
MQKSMEKTEETNHPDGDVTEIRWKIMEQKSGGNPWRKKKTLENPWIKKGRSGELDNFT